MTTVPAYQFASKGYAAQFPDKANADRRWGNAGSLRTSCLEYLKTFDEKSWFDVPIVSILKGQSLIGGERLKTVDAFGKENGSQILSTDQQVEDILAHVRSYRAPKSDYLAEFERIDNSVMTMPHAATIMGNQMLDYRKQDGVTEVIEAQGANLVERRLNAALLADEAAGNVQIMRWPAFVGCVSNFSNFLDLSRKVMRNMEMGVPVVVLSRNNTTQHMFRWTLLLLDLMKKEGVDLGMLTYFSCSRAQKTKIFKACPECPAYFTCSREVAASVKQDLPKIMSSTGGPNTLVATALTPEVSTAIRLSGMIENKGQCTAMRHFVLPGCTEKTVDDIFKPTPVVDTPLKAMEDGQFAGLFSGCNTRKLDKGYKSLPSQPDIHFRMCDSLPYGIDEKWREPVIDVSSPLAKDLKTEAYVIELCNWLNTEQPISLAVNGDQDLAMAIFERTGLVVYSVGTLEKPALTAQARPEDGECFGEFPPRHLLETFTHLPVIIPSSTPGYNTYYTKDGLVAASKVPFPASLQYCENLFSACSPPVLGFVKTLSNYLADACGPKRGVGGGGRTPLFGLQRPPILEGSPNVYRVTAKASLDDVAPFLAPFYVTNARSQLQVSVDKATSLDLSVFKGLQVMVEDDASYQRRLATLRPNNVIVIDGKKGLEPLLAMHWISRLFPMGHIKSVFTNDDQFVDKFSKSRKWLLIESAHSKL